MKKKLTVILVLFSLFLLIGISSVRADQQTLSPNQYWGLGKYMHFGDELNFQLSSSRGINVYIVNSYQLSKYQSDPQDTAFAYYKEWIGVLSLTNSFITPEDGTYYVLMINPSDSQSTSVSISANIDYYSPPEPPEPETEYIYVDVISYDYTGWGFLIGYGIVSLIVFVFLVRKLKLTNNKLREMSQPMLIPQSLPLPNDFTYCRQCGQKIGKDIQFCSSCGAKQ